MRIFILVIGLAMSLFASGQNQTGKVLDNAVRVKFQNSFDLTSNRNELSVTKGHLVLGHNGLDNLNERYRATRMKRVFPDAGKFEEKHRAYGLNLWYDIFVEEGTTVDELIQKYQSLDIVVTAEPLTVYTHGDKKGKVLATNDPRFDEQWHYDNTGQTGGTPGADISLNEAWEIETGDSRVVVAVHDSGIDLYHPDLDGHLWTNEGEVPNDGIDNDNNGFIDDYYGYNFAAAVVGGDPSSVYDYGGHGTHTSGTIAAENNNGVGVSGVAGGTGANDGIRIMMLRLGDDDGSPYIYNPAPSFVYAADMGAVISSNSWGGGGYDQAIYDAISYFVAEAGGSGTGLDGGLVVISTGNSSSSSVDYRESIENVMMVSATNHNDQKAWYSNYGSWVDISAPGGETNSVSYQGVLSTLPGNSYGFYQGTSMACPHVTGLAALMVSKAFGTGLTNTQLYDAIITSADPIDAINPSYAGLLGSGRINAVTALESVATGSGASGGLIIAPVRINAEIQLGESASYTVRMVNTADYDIDVAIEAGPGSGNWLTLDVVNLSIAANGVAKFDVELESTTSGEQLESELILSYVSFNSQVSQVLPISMYTLGEQAFDVQDTLLFSTNYQGQTESLDLYLYNTGTDYLELTEATHSNDDFTVHFENTSISPEDSILLQVDFTPSVAGQILDSVFFTTNDPSQEIHKLVLSGFGNPNSPPAIQIDPEEISFEIENPTGFGVREFTITNTGDEQLTYSISLNPSKILNLENRVKKERKDSKDKESVHESQPAQTADGEINYLGSLLGSIDSPVDMEMGMAWDGEFLWIAEASSNQIYRFDVVNQVIVDSITSIASDGVKLDFDGEYLWEHDYRNQLIKYSLDGSVQTQIPLDQNRYYYEGIAVDGNGIWMAYNDVFVKIDSNTGEDTRQFTNNFTSYAESIESVGDKLIVMSNGIIYIIAKGEMYSENYTNYLAGYYRMETEGMAFDGVSAWVSFNDYGALAKIDLFSDFLSYAYPSYGTIDGGQTANVEIAYNLQNFDNGFSYYDEVLVRSNALENSEVFVPVVAHIKGIPEISLSSTSLSIDAYIGFESIDTLVISNTGSLTLNISDITASEAVFEFEFIETSLPPYESLKLPISVSMSALDTVNATLTITSNDLLNPSIDVSLKAIGRYTPEISVAPESIDLTLFEYQIDSVELTITNSGEGDLYYYTINEPIAAITESVVSKSEVFSSDMILTSKDQTVDLSSIHSYSSKPITIDAFKIPLFNSIEGVLEGVNEKYSIITDQIPNRYDFSDGEYGISIGDGGNDMYDGGNYLSTNIGGNISYTNGVINTSGYLGNESYFTAKFPGLFVFTGNLNGVSDFSINGGLGADGSGNVDGAVLSISIGGNEYLGFVKRVYNAYDPSVNHLIIVPNNGAVYHEFSTYSNNDDHDVHGLNGVNRIHYLLFASSSGGYIDDDAMLSIMESYLNIIDEHTESAIEPGNTASSQVIFDAESLGIGEYNYDVQVVSNDPTNPVIDIPTTLTIKPSAVLSASVDLLNFDAGFVGTQQFRSLSLENIGSDTLFISDYRISGSGFSYASGPDTIPPRHVGSIDIGFAPIAEQSYYGILTILSNDSTNYNTTVGLTGEGIPSAILQLDEPIIDTLALGISENYVVKATNKGTEVLNFRMIIEETTPLYSLIQGIEEIRKSSGVYEGTLYSREHTNSDGELIPSALVTDEKEVSGYVTSTGGKNILVLASDNSYNVQNVLDQLENSEAFGFIAYINTDYSYEIDLESLKVYDAVFIWDNYGHNNGADLGNVLADYVDAGGGVVTAVSPNSYNSLGGRWSTEFEKYTLYNTTSLYSDYGYYDYMAGDANFDHALLANVDTLNGGGNSYQTSAISENVSDNTEIVAIWNSGSPLIIASKLEDVRRVDLGFYPVSSDRGSGYWSVETDGTQIIVNAINYVANGISGSEADWVTASTYSVDSLAAGQSLDINFTVNTEGLNEGWRAARAIFYSNDSRETTISQYLNVLVDGTSELSMPDTLNFEDVTLGFESLKRFQVRNLGDGATDLFVEIDTLSSFSIAQSDTITIQPFNSRYIDVSFEATELGVFSEVITVHDLMDGQTKDVVLVANVLLPGKIRLEPAEIDLTVNYREEVDSEFTIHNDGEGDLKFVLEAFHLPSQIATTALNNTSEIQFDKTPKKGVIDDRQGHPVINGLGNDSFGYTYIDSREEDGPQYIWNDISATGTAIVLGDDAFEQVDLEFEFPLYGIRQKELFITSNGLLGFNETGITNPINAQIPGNGAPNGFVAPFWKDLTPNNGGQIFYEKEDDKIIVQYQGIPDYDNSGDFTFQVTLFKSGDILLMYNDMNGVTTDATIGLEQELGGSGLQIAFNSDYVTDGLAVYIASPVLKIDPQFTIGTVLPGDSLNIPFTYNSLEDLGGNHTSEISIISNDTVSTLSMVDLSVFVEAPSYITAYRDTIQFDSTYINIVSSEGVWFKNDSVGMLSIVDVLSSNDNFTMMFPHYEAQNQDSTLGFNYEMTYNSATGRIEGELAGLTTKLVAVKLYKMVDEKKLLVSDIEAIEIEEGAYEINDLLIFNNQQLWSLTQGEFYVDIFTTDHLSGIGAKQLLSQVHEVKPYEYSNQFFSLYKPKTKGAHSSSYTVASNAINTDEIELTAFGVGLESSATISVSLSEMEESLMVSDSSQQTFTVVNEGVDSVYFSLNVGSTGFESNLNPIRLNSDESKTSQSKSNRKQPGQSDSNQWLVPTALMGTPNQDRSSENEINATVPVNDGTYFYGNVYSNEGRDFSYSQISDPSQVNSLVDRTGSNFTMASEFVFGSETQLLDLDFAGNLSLIDLESETVTYLSTLSGNGDWSGLTTDPISGNIYASTVSGLYELNTNDYSVTYIGGYNHGSVIGIAIDDNGSIYGYTLNDELIAININTGGSTYIGDIGFNANFGQDMAYNQATGEFYMAAFNNDSFRAELRLVNTETGSTSLVGAIASDLGDPQVTSIAFPINGVSSGFFSVDVQDSVLAPGQSVEIIASFNATGLKNGKYTTKLKVSSNDLSNPKIEIPVALQVEGNVPVLGEYTSDIKFGLHTVMDSIYRTARVENAGKEVLSLVLQNEIEGFYSDYHAGDTLRVDVNSIVDIPVWFIPNSASTFELDMTWLANDTLQSRVVISLAGAGERAPQELLLGFESYELELPRKTSSTIELSMASVGKDTISYVAEMMDSLVWISGDSISSTIAPDSTNVFVININTDSLEIGEYTSQVILKSNDPLYDSISIPIVLQVVNIPVSIGKDFPESLLAIDEDSLSYTLSEFFMDEDMDVLAYDVASKHGLVSTSVENGVLELSGISYGIDSIAVSVFDMQGDTLVTTFPVMSNNRPVSLQELPDIYATLSGDFLELVDLDDYFLDMDDDLLMYEIHPLDSGFAELFINEDNVLFARGAVVGKDEVEVTAYDGFHYQTQTFELNIDTEIKEPVKFYPNPVAEQLGIEFKMSERENVTFQLIDLVGNEIKMWDIDLHAGVVNESFDVSGLHPGVYLMNVIVNDEIIVVQRVLKK